MLIRCGVVAVALLWLLAAWSYPGWSALDAASTAYDPMRNFVCDLLASRSPDGRSNALGATAMNLGALVLLACLLTTWWRRLPAGPWSRVARGLGVASAALVLVVCVEQLLDLSLSHNLLVLAAAAAGLLPTALVAVADWRAVDATAFRRALLGVTLTSALVNFVSYSLVQAGGELTEVVPAAQNLALAALLLWLAALPVETIPRGLRGTGSGLPDPSSTGPGTQS